MVPRVTVSILDTLRLTIRAKYVRQTILLSRFETPEIRALFNHHLHNLAGKVRLDAPAAGYNGVLDRVRPGVRQIFERLDGEKAKEAVSELDERFDWFTKKVRMISAELTSDFAWPTQICCVSIKHDRRHPVVLRLRARRQLPAQS